MNRWLTLGILFVLILGASVAQSGIIPLRADVQDDKPQIEILRYDANLVQFEVLLGSLELYEGILDGKTWDRVQIPGGSYDHEYGVPELPSFSHMIAIPAHAGVRVEFEALEVRTFTDLELMPMQEDEPEAIALEKSPVRYSSAAYQVDASGPEVQAVNGEPALMGGIRLVPVKMKPVRYNPVTRELKVAHRFLVNVYFEGTDLRNQQTRPIRPMSQYRYNMLKEVIPNLDHLDIEVTPMGTYLIIAENNSSLLNVIAPLVDWKNRMGHEVVVETFTNGASNTTIKNIIQNAYDNWDVPPEWVLLFGDTGGDYAIPAWYVSYSYYSANIDQPYSEVDGGDILADVSVARYPADNEYQASMMVNKTLCYEKQPYVTNPSWFSDGVLVAGSSASGLSSILCSRSIKDRMVQLNYTDIDTFWYTMGSPGVVSTMVNGINGGTLYVNYRGWLNMEGFGNDDIQNLTNSLRLPFVAIPTCGTGGWGNNSNLENFMNVGTPTAPKGAIACFATATTGTHTRFNNAVDVGTFAAIFDEGCPLPGPALDRGKIELYNAFWEYNFDYVQRFNDWNTMGGDPGLIMYTHAIQYLDADIPASTTWGENSLTLTVNEPGVGPVEEAVVCFYKEGDIKEVGWTDASGQITLPLGPATGGNVKVTITKQNYQPIVDSLDVVQEGVAVGYYSHSIDDDNSGSSAGDSDGIANPGETVELPLVFKNFGNSTSATNVTVTAVESDDFASLSDASEAFPNIAPGGTANSSDDFDLVIDPDCPDGHTIQLYLTTSSDQGVWDGMMEVEVVSYDMTLNSYTLGSDTVLTPGETSNFVLYVRNVGSKSASSLTAALSTNSPYVTINDASASFGTIGIGATGSCIGNPFNVTCDADTPPGYPAEFDITFASFGGATQTVTMIVSLGNRSSADPQGPDGYGYWCYDNTDTQYPLAPDYSWVEIVGVGQQLPINDTSEDQDMSVIVNLPFTFQYYGVQTNQITVCSNGWISSTPNVVYTNFANHPIPNSMGPFGLIAPFWDDLVTGSGGAVYGWHDSANHRYIVQWDYMRQWQTYSPSSQRFTFEAILYDPAYYPTPTGDSEIVFQYQEVYALTGASYDIPYFTTGIEKPDHTDGIEVCYWNTYHDPAASTVTAGRAMKFTTAFDYSPPGAPNVTINLTYNSGSPVPAGGGNLYFDVYVENEGATPVDFNPWIDIEYEGGAPTTVIQRSFTNYQPGWSINRPNMFFPIPGAYAAGNYEFIGRVGIHPSTIWNEDGFPFTKSGADGGGDFVPFVPDNVPDYFAVITGGDGIVELPQEYEIVGTYPNPFNPTTTISYALPEAGKVSLMVYDISGRQVANLVNGYRNVGTHHVQFDAQGLASGIYIYRMTAGEFNATGKLVLMK
ncbi:T9SS type A sorting domain-containing protein [bacterium]|nr:T9SS type A sorting domain-containing protein [bacterium]MBU1881900.1 T9SS type A sorting domain-containing protein [bacterium]